MRPTTPAFRRATALGVLALLTLGACKAAQPGAEAGKAADGGPAGANAAATPAGALDPNLANPEVGDVWAAELAHFSRASFGMPPVNGQPGKAFGLMKVIGVTPTTIVAVTEQGSWPEERKAGALGTLRGDMTRIRWDPGEEITINRSDLPALVAAGQILETRRGAPGHSPESPTINTSNPVTSAAPTPPRPS